MGSIIEKEKGKMLVIGKQTEQNLLSQKYRFVEEAVTLLGKTDEKIIIPLTQMYQQFENILVFGNDIMILQQKISENHNYFDNTYPLLSYFRPYPVSTPEDHMEKGEEIQTRVRLKEMGKSKRQVIFCIKQLRDNCYLRSFINACEFYQIQLLLYDDVFQIPPSYLFAYDLILGFDEAKAIVKYLEAYQNKKLSGNVYFFCSKELKKDLDQCQHIRVKEIKKNLNKIQFPFLIETNILEIIEKMFTSGMNPYQKIKKKHQERERPCFLDFRGLDNYLHIFVCVREKSQEDYAIFVAMKKIENTYPMLKVRKVYVPVNDFSVSRQDLKTKSDPIFEYIAGCSFSIVVLGKSIKSFHAISGLIQKNGLENRVVLLRKNQTENTDDLKHKAVRMLEKNELPRIENKIPLKIVVLGTQSFFLKIAYELPLFDIKNFIDQNEIENGMVHEYLKKMNNQIVVINCDTWEKYRFKLFYENLKVQVICFDRREKIEEILQQEKIPYCSNQTEFADLTVKLINDRSKYKSFPLNMQGNYHHRKMKAISNHCQQIFSDLKVKHQLLESPSSDIFLFECQKWVQFDISQALIPSYMTLYTSNFDFIQITFRIKQKLIQQLFYLRKLGNLPSIVIEQLAKTHHSSTQELSIHVAKLFCLHSRFRRVTNRIFTQILYQNKRQFIEYMPYLFFVMFFSFAKSCFSKNYMLTKKYVKIISNDVSFANVKKFLKAQNKSLYTTEFILGQIYDKPIEQSNNENIYLIEIKSQILNEFSQFFPFFYIPQKNLLLIPPLTRLENYSIYDKIFLNIVEPQEQTFLTYFFKLVFNETVLRRAPNSSINLVHKLMDLFRNKRHFTLQTELITNNKYLQKEYIQSLGVLNKVFQGKYHEASLRLTPANRTSKKLLSYINTQKDKICRYYMKFSSNLRKKKLKREKWVSSYDDEGQKWIIKSMNHSSIVYLKNKQTQIISIGQTQQKIEKKEDEIQSEDFMPVFNEVLQQYLYKTTEKIKTQELHVNQGLANFFKNFLNTSNLSEKTNKSQKKMEMYDEQNQRVFIFSNPFHSQNSLETNGSQKKIQKKKSVRFLINSIGDESQKSKESSGKQSSSFGTKASIPNQIPQSLIKNNRNKY